MMDPSTVSGAIIWGVVSGTITTAILFIASSFAKKVVIPWYQSVVYQGVDLRGSWAFQKPLQSGGIFSVHLVLKQNAHLVHGVATLTKSGATNGNYAQDFEVDGTTWEGFLVINMRSSDRKSLSFVSGLLKITGRGDVLEGHWVYRSFQPDSAVSEALRLDRQNSVP